MSTGLISDVDYCFLILAKNIFFTFLYFVSLKHLEIYIMLQLSTSHFKECFQIRCLSTLFSSCFFLFLQYVELHDLFSRLSNQVTIFVIMQLCTS